MSSMQPPPNKKPEKKKRERDFFQEKALEKMMPHVDRTKKTSLAEMAMASTLGNMKGKGVVGMYCLKCKQQSGTKNVKQTKTANGRNIMKGVCTTCGTKKCRFVK